MPRCCKGSLKAKRLRFAKRFDSLKRVKRKSCLVLTHSKQNKVLPNALRWQAASPELRLIWDRARHLCLKPKPFPHVHTALGQTVRL